MRQLTTLVAFACPVIGLAQISIYDAAYRVEADAKSGSIFDTHTSFSNSLGPVQVFNDRVDSFANQLPSTVHSWAEVSWNCTPTILDAELIACWNSVDLGAGNSGRMLSELNLGIHLPTVHFVTMTAVFDWPSSFIAFDRWNGSSWVQIVNQSQVNNYAGLWSAGDYRMRAKRLYNRTGNSTGCVPFDFQLQAQPVPEPGTMVALGAGAVVVLRRRRSK